MSELWDAACRTVVGMTEATLLTVLIILGIIACLVFIVRR